MVDEFFEEGAFAGAEGGFIVDGVGVEMDGVVVAGVVVVGGGGDGLVFGVGLLVGGVGLDAGYNEEEYENGDNT